MTYVVGTYIDLTAVNAKADPQPLPELKRDFEVVPGTSFLFVQLIPSFARAV
jgi:hypothetical protein